VPQLALAWDVAATGRRPAPDGRRIRGRLVRRQIRPTSGCCQGRRWGPEPMASACRLGDPAETARRTPVAPPHRPRPEPPAV